MELQDALNKMESGDVVSWEEGEFKIFSSPVETPCFLTMLFYKRGKNLIPLNDTAKLLLGSIVHEKKMGEPQ